MAGASRRSKGQGRQRPGTGRKRGEWRPARLPNEVMEQVKQTLPDGAANVRTIRKGNKVRVLYDAPGGQRVHVFPWNVSAANYRIFPGGQVQGQGQPGQPVINITPNISPHIEVKPVINAESREERREERQRPEPAPVPERQFFNFEELRRDLRKRIADKMKEGRIKFVDKKNRKPSERIESLRETSELKQGLNQAFKEYRQTMLQILENLQNEVRSENVNWNNRNDYDKRFQEALDKAENAFWGKRNKLLDKYHQDLRGIGGKERVVGGHAPKATGKRNVRTWVRGIFR